jgi:ribosomal protein S18 acetylase RimI-like enzyme
VSGVVIRRYAPDAPGAAALIARAEAEVAQRYPAEHRHGLAVEGLVRQRGRFFVAEREGAAVGCGGFVPLEDGAAELKRMHVAGEARGAGIARRLLAEIEAGARAEGIATMRLETGTLQAEAIALYRSAGYRERGPLPPYTGGPVNLFMEKTL